MNISNFSRVETEYLQLALSRSGHYSGEIDGIPAESTLEALRRFQADNGLSPDGKLSDKTRAALRPYLTGYIVHTIRRGDTLWSLSQKTGASLESVMTANPGLIPEAIPIGTRINLPLSFEVVPTNVSWTHGLLVTVAEGLLARYPFMSAGSYGESVTGKKLVYFTLGEGAAAVGYNASHHANEWITTPVLMRFLERYAAAYTVGADIGSYPARELFSGATLYLTPLVNPDGVDLVNGALSSGGSYLGALEIAKAYPDIPFPSGWKANILGTDLNLNYPAGWENAREIKYAQGVTSPAPRDYVGPTVLSEPESRAMYLFTRIYDFALTLSYHSQGEVIYWKYLDRNPRGSYEIARRMELASGYAVEETPGESGYAGYKDWFIDEFDRPGFTVEVGLGENPLPIGDFEGIYAANEGILAIGLDAARSLGTGCDNSTY